MNLARYKQCKGDHKLFFQHSPSRGVTVLIFYVDDIIIIGNNNKEANKLKVHLTNHFEIKNLGSLKYFHGIEIAQSRKGLVTTQKKYISDLLNKNKLLQWYTNKNPIEVNHKLMLKENDPKIDMNLYKN